MNLVNPFPRTHIPTLDFHVHYVHYIHLIHYWLLGLFGEHMSELSERLEKIPEKDEILYSLKVNRASDFATITPLKDSIKVNASPHSIGDSYVTEGFVTMAEVEREYSIKNGRRNQDGVGYRFSETKMERQPLVLVATVDQGAAWLDCDVFVHSGEGLALNGEKVQVCQFCEFQGGMDTPGINAILAEDMKDPNFTPLKPFEDILEQVNAMIEMDPCAARIMALWISMSYVHDAFDAFPYLWFNGIKGSGKTRALELIEQTAYHAEMNMRISNPALFRLVDQNRITICYDEAENLLVGGASRADDQDRVSLFNSGYRSSGAVRLVEKDGDNFVIRRFRSYSPKALASIHPIDEALQSRCILVSMMTALDPSKGNRRLDTARCAEIRRELFKFRFSCGPLMKGESDDEKHNEELRSKYDLKNRDWELFKPLLIGAEMFCPEWLDDVASFIDSQKVVRQVENQFSTDAMVLWKLIEVAKDGENAPGDAVTTITYKELLSQLKEDYPETKKWMTSKSLGNCLRRLGCGGMTVRHGNGWVLRLDRALFEKQALRLGITVEAPKLKTGLESFGGGT